MSKILIQTSAGELIDKITILEIKKEKISDKKSLEIINTEYDSLKNSIKENIKINREDKKIIKKTQGYRKTQKTSEHMKHIT